MKLLTLTYEPVEDGRLWTAKLGEFDLGSAPDLEVIIAAVTAHHRDGRITTEEARAAYVEITRKAISTVTLPDLPEPPRASPVPEAPGQALPLEKALRRVAETSARRAPDAPMMENVTRYLNAQSDLSRAIEALGEFESAILCRALVEHFGGIGSIFDERTVQQFLDELPDQGG